MKSGVDAKYNTKYRAGNWAEYDQALVQRGGITLWISEGAMDDWKPVPSGGRGGPRKFSDHSITTAWVLRLVFKLPLRQTEGLLRSLLSLMGVAHGRRSRAITRRPVWRPSSSGTNRLLAVGSALVLPNRRKLKR
jgi:hypothetical protein